jgi:hypothetical protein
VGTNDKTSAKAGVLLFFLVPQWRRRKPHAAKTAAKFPLQGSARVSRVVIWAGAVGRPASRGFAADQGGLIGIIAPALASSDFVISGWDDGDLISRLPMLWKGTFVLSAAMTSVAWWVVIPHLFLTL